MRWHNCRLYSALFLALAVMVYWLGPFGLNPARPVFDEDYFDELMPQEIKEGRYFRVVDEEDRLIVITGRRLRAGDSYLSADNRLYEVYAVEEYLVRARYRETIKIGQPQPMGSPAAAPEPDFLQPVRLEPAYRIAIYHSHNAESFVPSDGVDSIYGRGGIHDVGVAFRTALEDKGIEVLHSERLHLPHDRGAYRRSRVTAQQLLAQRPDAIFDVHRDAAPWEAYSMEINGELITRIHFVVGLSNPNYAANRTYAFDLKGYADRIHPGLVRGIFLIWGGYNQDLSPMNLLLEVGAHTNTKEAAMRGITLFADVVAYYFYGPEYLEKRDPVREPVEEEALPPALYRDAGGISGAISGTILSLLLTSLGAALGFYFLNNPDALEHLFHWWERLPERTVAFAGQFVLTIRNLPQLSRQMRADFPDNIRFAFERLRREIRDTPARIVLFLKKGQGWGARIGQEGRLWLQNLPQNWRRAWALFLWESKKLPGFLRRRAVWLSSLIKHALAWVKQTVPPVWNKAIKNLRLAGRGIVYESGHLFTLLREKIAMLRNRLRT